MIPCDPMGIPPPTQKFKSSNQDARTKGSTTTTKNAFPLDGSNPDARTKVPDDDVHGAANRAESGVQELLACSANSYLYRLPLCH